METPPSIGRNAPAPSGAQHAIASGEHRAIVVERGGGVRAYVAGGVHVLDGYGEDEPCPAFAGQLLAPWPNRLGDGRYRFGGEEHAVPISEPALRTALHGLVHAVSWELVARAPDAVVLRHALRGQPGYPFPIELTVRWSVGAEGLRAEHTATNTGDGPCPFGFGAHPYLMVPGAAVDDLWLRVPASRWLVPDARKLPVEERSVEGTGLDFRERRRIGATQIDCAFTGVLRDPDGIARARLTDASGAGVELWMDAAFGVVQVYTSDMDHAARHRRSVAIEPMTCEPNAFQSGRGLVVLEPGASLRGAWGVRPFPNAAIAGSASSR